MTAVDAAPKLKKHRTDAATDDHAFVVKMINGLVKCFHKKCGGDYEEWLAVANVAFMEARERYDVRKTGFNNRPAKFSSYVQTKVYWALVNHRSEHYKHGKAFAISNVDPEALGLSRDEATVEGSIPDRARFALANLAFEVSDDAAVLAFTLIDRFTGSNPNALKPDVVQHHLLGTMRDEFGWVAKRYWQAVKELWEVFSS